MLQIVMAYLLMEEVSYHFLHDEKTGTEKDILKYVMAKTNGKVNPFYYRAVPVVTERDGTDTIIYNIYDAVEFVKRNGLRKLA